ncbi:hypothetical protein KJ586_04995 [Patescibacteria group bacterium]|nr:hypothetical protein [Patescibacteria group bacterium]
MILFTFTINDSFLEYSNQPITIPKKYHASLISSIYQGNGCRTIPVHIEPPAKRILDGEIYYGRKPGGEEYYQIKALGAYPGYYFGDLKIGDIVYVGITISGAKINVKIFLSADPVQAYLVMFQSATPEQQANMVADLKRLL